MLAEAVRYSMDVLGRRYVDHELSEVVARMDRNGETGDYNEKRLREALGG